MKENISNAIDKLENVDDKMECIISAISFIDIDSSIFNDKDVAGFNKILRDLQNEIRETKELLK